ncbi:hypothetical protein LTR91_023166 [Friedmanniomyces endolithicus]|uniref:YDG domain-containing protein n=1 Tax=Friedmanniomyces endolithicus TaxID=329885 RepID=A0AAN6JYK5_9PEZI|nr:hypothetical protein LTR94_020768 [Friedmanniomyces endolithicus]KAK0773316.1 hypothetical protein LTR38_016607 [Friedmanniomyces endolithicus]KAK0778521.1 hypothetical protein LTR59_013489 [Friedmanniomyces endolithicus]KAK0848583.1 hypothetical protein LTS02_013995 [Friedmanniomyces endolithicus]KAK0900971.1 hypothetical protein LTR57_020394 [Friedmanniomyces endolithicus]
MRPIKPKPSNLSIKLGQPSVYNPDFLRQRARWIRDDLDPQIARNGHDALHADDILKLDDFLRQLLSAKLSIEDIRSSRIHLAVLEIAGRGTRWPKRLIERCDAVKGAWEVAHGPLQGMGFALYEGGGRLQGICRPEDLSKELLIVKWLRTPGAAKLSPVKALRSGDLGFKPGEWWISPLFAFRDGIINGAEAEGGIVSDLAGAYAVVMTGKSEESSTSPNEFVYQARSSDKGRYRLTAGTPESRHPVRILRSHTLRSFWAPKAGLRYDGLVAGWTIKMDAKKKEMVYFISFKRLPDQLSMDEVLRRPWTEEIEDYREYKRLRRLARDKQTETAGPRIDLATPTGTTSMDGIVDVYEDGMMTPNSGSEEEDNSGLACLRRSAVTSRGATGLGPCGIAATAETMQDVHTEAGERTDSLAG